MRIRTALLICWVLPSLTGCTAASHQIQPTVQGESMRSMLADVDQVRAYVYGTGTRTEAEKAATDLVTWSNRLAELFPSGQASTDYVDMSPERAHGAPLAMNRSAAALLTTIRASSRAATGDQLARTERDGCGYCHLSGTR